MAGKLDEIVRKHGPIHQELQVDSTSESESEPDMNDEDVLDNESENDNQRDQLATEDSDDNSPIKLDPTDMELDSPEASGAPSNANMTQNPSKKPPAVLQVESPHPQPPTGIQLGPSPTHPLTPLALLLPADIQGIDDDGPVMSRSHRKRMPIWATDDECLMCGCEVSLKDQNDDTKAVKCSQKGCETLWVSSC